VARDGKDQFSGLPKCFHKKDFHLLPTNTSTRVTMRIVVFRVLMPDLSPSKQPPFTSHFVAIIRSRPTEVNRETLGA
jgi:hypothetical protein